jgi:hypothetical protein
VEIETVERFNRRLLVDGEYDRMLRRIDIDADDMRCHRLM